MSATNLAISLNILWKVIEAHGHDPRPLFADIGVSPEQAADPDARIRSVLMEQLQVRSIELLGDPCIGMEGVRFWHPSYLGALGYAWLASSTLRTALQRLQRYLKLVTGIMTIRLEETREGLLVGFAAKPGYLDLPQRYDYFASLVVHMCRLNSGDTLAPVRVSLTHESFPCCKSYKAWFSCPVEFAAAENAVVFATEQVDRRLTSGNPQLAQLHDQIIIRFLAKLDRNDIAQRVKAAILDGLQAGSTSDDAVAETLHMSVRTLQRKLGETGTSFRDLVDETRRELAQAYIRDRTVSLNELAFMLGFSDNSAFSRAYKRWTGRTPTEARAA